MKYLLVFIVVITVMDVVVCKINTHNNVINYNVKSDNTNKDKCNINCSAEDDKMVCAFDAATKTYKLFANNCTMLAYATCHNIGFFQTETNFCINNQMKASRRMYGESCPVFCPSHYRPVCAASKLRQFNYKAFNNGCQLDMVICRGIDEDGYVEVPLDFCQRHLMRNIFNSQVVISGFSDYRDYHDY